MGGGTRGGGVPLGKGQRGHPEGGGKDVLFWSLLGAVASAFLTVGLVLILVPALVRRALTVVLTRPMSDTLAELYVSTRSTTPMQILYASLRAATGDLVIRPMGSARPTRGLDNLALVPAQLARRPVRETQPVDLSCTIGRRAKKPLSMKLPLYMSGMAYGLAITREARLAMARASGEVGIALNSGQGPFLPEERQRCWAYVLQFGRWDWNRDPQILRQADMIEVQVGQGAMPGNAVLASPTEVGPEVRARMGLRPGQSPDIHADLYLTRPDEPASLAQVVRYLREVTDGIPIAVKMGAGDHLEADLDVALEAGVDVVVLDGTEGATGNAPITLSDHFGIPTLDALVRAVAHLERRGARGEVDLLVSGGLREPGDFLKAYALGADAVGLATVILFALAHPQIAQAVPFYPPTSLVFYRSRPAIPLDVDRASQALVNFFRSCQREMEVALRAMGHDSVKKLTRRDVCALDPDVAVRTGLHYSADPWPEALWSQGPTGPWATRSSPGGNSQGL
jgi:glutamate synthase domain-containing protein 2